MALALALSLAACASLASVPAEKETTDESTPKLVRFANVLVPLWPAEQAQLQGAVKVGSEFLTNGLADGNEVRVLHYKWKSLRIDNNTQGLGSIAPSSTTFGKDAPHMIRFRYEAVNLADPGSNYVGFATLTFASDWRTIIDFEF